MAAVVAVWAVVADGRGAVVSRRAAVGAVGVGACGEVAQLTEHRVEGRALARVVMEQAVARRERRGSQLFKASVL